ncbi:HAD family hydrolase [Paenibacillus sp. D2_2]|uniref:HAD family hydrolase n=1 Tax=Paenibacillus sp. D2_2 TaxID=3073092 RepID=UPI0028155F0A|nr:HAD family hydrolase [Paenibacillus sp. D2_2]WMT41943.1 HAD family hydrolase [Paenibacillus sp. D2_2]
MNPIRLIVSDLDGTLLSADHTLPSSTATAIREYINQGGYFTLATGRPFITARPIIQQLKLNLPIILCNGAVLTAANGMPLERYGISLNSLYDLLTTADQSGLDVLLFCGDEVQTLARNINIAAYERKEGVTCSLISLHEIQECGTEIEKAILLGPVEHSRRLFAEFAERSPVLHSMITAFQSEDNYLELVPGQVSKGTALHRLAAMLDIPLDQVMTIGNQLNDLPMLEAAGIGVAVANSPDELKQAADYVCEASYSEGVLEAMERYIEAVDPKFSELYREIGGIRNV